jgi:hypothetical protein
MIRQERLFTGISMRDSEIKSEISYIIEEIEHDRIVDRWIEITEDYVEIYFKIRINDEKKRDIPITIPKHIMETEILIGEPTQAVMAGLYESMQTAEGIQDD